MGTGDLDTGVRELVSLSGGQGAVMEVMSGRVEIREQGCTGCHCKEFVRR
jgi:hypothetical protein